MSQEVLPDSSTPSDPELIAAVRGGDRHAYGMLFERHRSAALSLARQVAGPSEADDLVSDAFLKVLRVLSAGGGPDVAFRAYLLTAVRRLHVDRIRRSSKVIPSDDLEQWDPGLPFSDPAVDKFENATAAKAFAALPERWQLVLWHLEVENQKPADVAPLLGLSANSVSALAYRAREGLRQSYLQMHLADTAAEDCRWTTERLGAHVRRGLSKRESQKVEKHLDECPRCAAVYLELTEVNSRLSGIIAPLLLGSAAAGYLASTASGSSAAGFAGWLLQAQTLAREHAVAVGSAAAGTAIVVGVGSVALIQGLGGGSTTTSGEVNAADSRVGPGAASDSSSSAPVSPGTSTTPSQRKATRTGSAGRTTGRTTGANVPGRSTANPSGPVIVPPITSTGPAAPNSQTSTGATGPGNSSSPTSRSPGQLGPGNTGPLTTGPTNGGPGNTSTHGGPTQTPSSSGTPTTTSPGTTSSSTTSTTPTTPTSTSPTTTPPPPPPPPPPPGVDVSLSLDVGGIGPLKYQATLDTDTEEPATDLTLTIEATAVLTLSDGGNWTCVNSVDQVRCRTNTASPGDVVVVTLHGSRLSATVTARDNDDPNLSNNTVTWSG